MNFGAGRNEGIDLVPLQQRLHKRIRFVLFAIELHLVDQLMHLSLFGLGGKDEVFPGVLPTRVPLQQLQLDGAG